MEGEVHAATALRSAGLAALGGRRRSAPDSTSGRISSQRTLPPVARSVRRGAVMVEARCREIQLLTVCGVLPMDRASPLCDPTC